MDFNHTLSFERLIKECIKGNRESQKELYDKYSPKLFPVCLHYSPNKKVAEEILIEVFVYTFNNLHLYNIKTSFNEWIGEVTLNMLIEYNSKEKSACIRL